MPTDVTNARQGNEHDPQGTRYGRIQSANDWAATGRVGYWLSGDRPGLFGIELQAVSLGAGFPRQTVETTSHSTQPVPTLVEPTPTCPAPCIQPIPTKVFSVGPATVPGGHVRLSGGFVNLLLRLPDLPVTPYVEAGFGFLATSGSGLGFGDLRTGSQAYNLGAGVEIPLSHTLAVTLAYQRISTVLRSEDNTKATLDIDLATGGLVWHFH